MDQNEIIRQEKEVLRWGGLSGLVGGALLILSMVVAFIFVPADPLTYAELVARFPDVLLLRVAENILYLLGLVCGLPLILALYFSLRKTSLAHALFGSTFSLVGLTAMIVGATPHVAHSAISEIYHTSGTSPESQQVLGLIWKSVWGVTDLPLYVGFLVGMLGFILISIAMFKSAAFSKAISWVSVIIAAVGTASALFQLIEPASDFGAISFFAYLIFYFVLGGRITKLSKAH